MAMKLYMHPGACSLSPHIVCRELDLPVELVEVDRRTHAASDGEDFLRINGNGYVPALVLEDGQTLTEGPAIVQYLADLRPEAGLLPPPGCVGRAQVQSWLNFVTAELHKPMVMLMLPAYAPARAALAALVDKRLDWLAGQIAGPYLTGGRFTVADAYLFVCLNWSPWNGVDLARRPALEALHRRVAARPAVQAALAAEGLVRRDDGFFGPRPAEAVVAAGAQ
ncbi:glutathione S-transferase N-terminal domain-containing protein [Inquilinus limosus]|uniref:glutathione S-transferase N-terminal domain-containing protein n=1 Tax=Inquilinus limosus TaxID=171674 RepID=UPI00316AC34E